MYNQIWIIYRKKIDKYIFFIKTRWIITSLLLLTYIYRLAVYGGFYVVSYIMGLYLLHLSVQFFTPLGLPDIEDEIEDTVFNELPTTRYFN